MAGAVGPVVKVVDQLFLLGLQLVGWQVGGVFVAGVGNAGDGFGVTVSEASATFFEERARESLCECVARLAELVAFDRGVDPRTDALLVFRIEQGQFLPDRRRLKPRNVNIYEMSIEAACTRRRACQTALGGLFKSCDLSDERRFNGA